MINRSTLRFIPRPPLARDFERWTRRQLTPTERRLIAHIERQRHNKHEHTLILVDQDTPGIVDLCIDYLNWIHQRIDPWTRAAVIGPSVPRARQLARRLPPGTVSTSINTPDRIRGNTYEHLILMDADRLRQVYTNDNPRTRYRDYHTALCGATAPALTTPRGIVIILGSPTRHPRRPFARALRTQQLAAQPTPITKSPKSTDARLVHWCPRKILTIACNTYIFRWFGCIFAVGGFENEVSELYLLQ